MKDKFMTFGFIVIICVGVVALTITLHPMIFPKENDCKVWGQGKLSDEWQGFFGNDNTARLDFVQTQTINRQGQRIAELALRISKLEDPDNEPKESKTPD